MTPNDLTLGTCSIRLDESAVHWPDRSLPLTPRECALLRALVDAQGQCVPNQHILSEVWGYHRGVQTRAVALCVTRLRRKIEPEPGHPRWLLTVRGRGYRLVVPAGAPSTPTGTFAREVLRGMDRAGGWRLLREVVERWEDLATSLAAATEDEAVDIACVLGECAWRLDLSRPADPLWGLHERLPPGPKRGRVAVALARVLWQGAATGEADTLLEQTLSEPWAVDPPSARARRVVASALVVRAWTRRLLGATPEALEHARRAHVHARGLADRKLQGAAADQVASALYDLGSLTEAHDWFEDALLQLRRTEDVRGLALCENNFGVLLNEMGNVSSAIELIESAIAGFTAERHLLDAAGVLCNLAEMLLNAQRLDEAAAKAHEAEALCREQAYARGLTRALRVQGRIAVEHSELRTAEVALRRAIHCAQTSSLPVRAAYAQLDLGWVLHALERPEGAIDAYRCARSCLVRAGSQVGVGLADLWWACLERDPARLARAHAQLRLCGSPLATLICDPFGTAPTSYAARRTLAAAGRPAFAFAG